MNDVFGTPEPQNVPQGEPIPEAPETAPAGGEGAAPPAADTEKLVPLTALEAERSGRRDWKEKALRLEGELKALKEQPRAPERQLDPQQLALMQADNTRLNTSEMLVRDRYGDAEVDKAWAKFQELMQKDPTLNQRAAQQKHPWDFVIKEAKRAALIEQMGDDPDAYEAKLKAKWLAEQSNPAASRAPLPTSLAGARSSGARTAPAFNGPPPLSSLFKN